MTPKWILAIFAILMSLATLLLFMWIEGCTQHLSDTAVKKQLMQLDRVNAYNKGEPGGYAKPYRVEFLDLTIETVSYPKEG